MYRLFPIISIISIFILWPVMLFGRSTSEKVSAVTDVKSHTKTPKLRNQIFCGGGNDTTKMNCSPACQALLRKFAMEGKVSSWNRRHASLAEHYRRFNCTTAIEIGIARAELSTYLLSSLPAIVEYHAVDPFLGGYDPNDITSNVMKEHDNSIVWMHAILQKMKPFGCRFQLHYGLSSDVRSHFSPRSHDCLFVDGNHQFEGVQEDIANYAPLVKPGGFLVFDDYYADFPGVVRAVDALVLRNNLTLHKVNQFGNVFVQKPLHHELLTG